MAGRRGKGEKWVGARGHTAGISKGHGFSPPPPPPLKSTDLLLRKLPLAHSSV